MATREYIPRKVQDPLVRFTRSYVVDEQTGCWNWIGNLHGYKMGYGVFWVRFARVQAHRWSYERFIGPIPFGLGLDHLCRNTKCVNPRHLEPVTQRENVRRGCSLAAERARQTHCIHGHAFDAANTYVRANGRRRCRACNLATYYKIQQRKKVANGLS